MFKNYHQHNVIDYDPTCLRMVVTHNSRVFPFERLCQGLLILSLLLTRFKLAPSETTVVYHHWYDLNTGKRILQEGTGSTKTCPGTNFFGGNTAEAFKKGLLPLLK